MTVLTETHGHVLKIVLNRPHKRNAFDPEMYHALARALGDYDRDDAFRCAVLTAAGDHFSAGIDLAQFAPLMAQPGDPFAVGEGEIDPFGLRNHLSKPLIVAAHGISFTIAIELMLAADIRLAAPGTRLGQLEIARGLYPLGGATIRLQREAGWGNAMRWLLTADEFGPEEALRCGLIQEIGGVDRAMVIAQRIAEQAPLGVRATLRSARLALERGEVEAAARLQDDMPGILASSDFAEGVASFRERRKAEFRGY